MNIKDILDIIVRIIIILLFIAVLVINIMEISNFGSSRAKLLSLSSKENNPSYDSLNMRYCNYSSMFSEKDTINNSNLGFIFIYGILFLLFWYNTIINVFSSSALSNEIKILFYKNIFNYDIYKKYNYEYTFINGLRIFILISLLFHLYILYSEYMGTNEEDIKIHENIKIIDAAIMENIDCDLIRSHDSSVGKYITRDTLAEHLKKNMESLKANKDVDKYFKICMSIILTNKNSNIAKKTIKDVKNLCDNPTCIYSKLENKMEDIFPENIDKHIDIIRSAIKTAGYQQLSGTDISQLDTAYMDTRKKLIDSFNIISSYKSSHVIYYKLGLITVILGGILFSIFGLAYFLIYDTKMINMMFSLNKLPLPLDYFVTKYFNSAIVYIAAIVSIYVAFIINF